jgi:nucleoid-associated protein Lsr2
MAQKMVVEVLDDIDGSPADRTVTFGLDGKDYEIDLSDKNADQLAKALEPFVAGARKVSAGRRSPAAVKHDQSAVREWARSQGMQVSDRGRIPASISEAYSSAH